MTFSPIIVCWKRSVGQLSPKRWHRLYSSLMSNDYNYDQHYYGSHENQNQILMNIRLRGLEDQFTQLFDPNVVNEPKLLSDQILRCVESLPNKLDPIWYTKVKPDFETVATVGTKRQFDFVPQKAEDLLQKLGLLYLSDRSGGNLGVVGGKNSYALLADLARLERAIIAWTTKTLTNEFDFESVVVPQLLYSDIIKSCGFNPSGNRSQVYRMASDQRVCLTGTAEQPLAALNIGETFNEEDLPKKYCSLSRCYRAEGKATKENWGLYRVHYFNKVEMFAITDKRRSSQMLDHFVDIQKTLFERLCLHFRVVDMPPHDLGVPAFRKFDIEAYMSGRDVWGEISSASNCTDYQSRRLNIKYRTLVLNEETNEIFRDEFCHTVNGTACAVPRMLIAICEQNQTSDAFIVIPEVLRPFMSGQTVIDKRQTMFEISEDPNTGRVLSL